MFHRCLCALLMGLSALPLASAESLLVVASQVRLRSSPAEDAGVVALLPLGTPLQTHAAERTEVWVPVTSTHSPPVSGWVARSLAVPVTAATWPAVVSKVIADRLVREGDGFRARAELVDFIEVVQQHDWDLQSSARLEWQRLRALQAALNAIAWRGAQQPDIARWVNICADIPKESMQTLHYPG